MLGSRTKQCLCCMAMGGNCFLSLRLFIFAKIGTKFFSGREIDTEISGHSVISSVKRDSFFQIPSLSRALFRAFCSKFSSPMLTSQRWCWPIFVQHEMELCSVQNTIFVEHSLPSSRRPRQTCFASSTRKRHMSWVVSRQGSIVLFSTLNQRTICIWAQVDFFLQDAVLLETVSSWPSLFGE